MVHQAFRFLLGFALTSSTSLCLSSAILAQELQTSDIAMWKVESPNNTVYLLGSIHVGKSCTLNSPKIAAAMADAEHTVFEIDFTKVTQAEQMQFSLDLANVGRLRPGDRTLKDSVRPETYERIRQKYNELKPESLPLTLDIINQTYRPPFIALQMQGFQIEKLGLTGDCGIDRLLISEAQAAQKNILALETFQQQSVLIRMMLEAIPTRDIEAEFQQLLAASDTQQVNTLLTSVMSGDLTTIQNKVTESCKPTPILCYKMLDARNIAWMDQIKTYLQDQDDYFIIVGAAHMIGPNSLISLLEKENYQVEPF